MTAILLSSKTVTARKPHQCSTCNTTAVKPGVQYRRETYVYDGRVYDWVSCEPCAAMAELVWLWANGQDGIDQDDYAEWASEFEDDPEYGEVARAYLSRLRPERIGDQP